MNALCHQGVWLKGEKIFNTQVCPQKGMACHGHAVEDRKNWVIDDGGRSSDVSEWNHVGDINFGRHALWSDIHNLLDTGQAGGRTLDDHSDRSDGQPCQDRVIGDVIEPCPTDDCSAMVDNRPNHRGFIRGGRFSFGPKYDLNLQRNLLVVRLAKDFLTEARCVQRLHTIRWSPRTKVAETRKYITPRRVSVWQISSSKPDSP